MQSILRFRLASHLTEQQIFTANNSLRNANRFNLTPTVFRILREAITLNRSLDDMERERAMAKKIGQGNFVGSLFRTRGIGGISL